MERKDFGVLYGQKTTEDALLIYSSYEDAKASPKMGDFIVLTPKDEGGTKYLARVEAEVVNWRACFSFCQSMSERQHFFHLAHERHR